MISPETARLFETFDRAAKGASLNTQIRAASLVIYQAIVTAARIAGIPRDEIMAQVMSGVGEFIATCEILERKGEAPEQEAASAVASDLIGRYSKPAAPSCASQRGLACDCPGVVCLVGSR